MSERAISFVEQWVEANVHPEAYEPEGDTSRAEAMAAYCRVAAKAEGITDAELNGSFENLTAFMAGQLEEATDREVERLVDKDRS